MEFSQLPFDEIVRARLKELGKTAFAVEQESDLPADAIRNVLRSTKKEGPSLARAKELCDALGLDFYIGPPRDNGPIELLNLDQRLYARIPLHDVELAAGAGSQIVDELVIDHLAFRRDWLKRIGLAAKNARLARVRGDSMLPILNDQDLVLLDTSKRNVPCRPRKPGRPVRADLYALFEDGSARVKRIEHSSFGTIVLHSDNFSLYPPETVVGLAAHDLKIIGKVVWWGHTVRE